MYTTSVPGNAASASQSSARLGLRRVLVAGHERDRAGAVAVRHRDPRVRGGGDARGHPGHDLERDPGRAQRLGLLAAAAEHERIAALQPHDLAPGGAVLDQQPLDLAPAASTGRRPPCRRRSARASGARAVERGRRDQPVVDDHVGGRDQLERASGQQPGIAGAGADQVDGHAGCARIEPLSARAAAQPRPAASIRSATREPESASRRPPQLGRAATPSRPAARPTRVSSSRPPSTRRAWAPTGVLHDAPSACTSSRSAPTHGGGVRDRPAFEMRDAAGHWPRARAHPGRRRARARRGSRPALEAEPLQPAAARTSASNCALGELAQAGVDVAAHRHDLEVVPQRPDLRRAPQAARPDPSARAPAPRATARRRSRRADRRARGSPPASGPPGARPGRPWPSARRRRSGPRAAPARARRPSATCRRPVRSALIVTSSSHRRGAPRPTAPASSASALAARADADQRRRSSRTSASSSSSGRLSGRERAVLALEPEQVAHERHPGVDAVVARAPSSAPSGRAAGG